MNFKIKFNRYLLSESLDKFSEVSILFWGYIKYFVDEILLVCENFGLFEEIYLEKWGKFRWYKKFFLFFDKKCDKLDKNWKKVKFWLDWDLGKEWGVDDKIIG